MEIEYNTKAPNEYQGQRESEGVFYSQERSIYMKCLNTYFSKKLNQEIDYEFLKLQYINGKSLRQIENEYGIGRAALSRHLKQDGVKILGNGVGNERRYLLKCNDNFFETIDNQDKAYCVGFFLADGSFLPNGIKFDQTEKDKEVLEYINKCLNGEQTIKTYSARVISDPYNSERTYVSQPMCRIAYSHIKLKEDLKKLGIQENKTYNFCKINIPEEY
jgi:hypothetical protein